MGILFTQLSVFRTKQLEEKYFTEANELRSKLEMAEEEKKRFEKVRVFSRTKLYFRGERLENVLFISLAR